MTYVDILVANICNIMSKRMSSHDKFLCLSSELGKVTTHIHLVIESHQEIINTIECIRAVGIGSRTNELKKVNEAFSIVDSIMNKTLNCTGYKKLHQLHTKNNLTNVKEKNRNHGFLSQSVQFGAQNNNTKFKQMITHVFPSKEYQIIQHGNGQTIMSNKRNHI